MADFWALTSVGTLTGQAEPREFLGLRGCFLFVRLEPGVFQPVVFLHLVSLRTRSGLGPMCTCSATTVPPPLNAGRTGHVYGYGGIWPSKDTTKP